MVSKQHNPYHRSIKKRIAFRTDLDDKSGGVQSKPFRLIKIKHIFIKCAMETQIQKAEQSRSDYNVAEDLTKLRLKSVFET